MGFFSGILGSGSEWDGSRYVEKLSGTKFWHNNFVDKDAMRQYGQAMAYQDNPTGARRRSQSVQTLPYELIFLLETCEMQHDTGACKKIAKAIEHLLENYLDKLIPYSDNRLIASSYRNYL